MRAERSKFDTSVLILALHFALLFLCDTTHSFLRALRRFSSKKVEPQRSQRPQRKTQRNMKRAGFRIVLLFSLLLSVPSVTQSIHFFAACEDFPTGENRSKQNGTTDGTGKDKPPSVDSTARRADHEGSGNPAGHFLDLFLPFLFVSLRRTQGRLFVLFVGNPFFAH